MFLALIALTLVLAPGAAAAGCLGLAKGAWRWFGVVLAFLVPLVAFGVEIFLTTRGDTSRPGMPVHHDGDPLVMGLLWIGLIVCLASATIGTGIGALIRVFSRRKAKLPDVF